LVFADGGIGITLRYKYIRCLSVEQTHGWSCRKYPEVKAAHTLQNIVSFTAGKVPIMSQSTLSHNSDLGEGTETQVNICNICSPLPLRSHTKIKSGLASLMDVFCIFTLVYYLPNSLEVFSNVLAVLAAILENSFTSSFSRWTNVLYAPIVYCLRF
jgi:hypothetical protein